MTWKRIIRTKPSRAAEFANFTSQPRAIIEADSCVRVVIMVSAPW